MNPTERRKVKIALTIGDPAGIGPEIAVRAASDPEFANIADIILYGSQNIIDKAAEFANIAKPYPFSVNPTGSLQFNSVTVGTADSKCGIAARDGVIAATKDAISGKVDAIVTAPMNKASVNLAEIPFTGHTELIAELCGIPEGEFVMMQSSDNLRVVFVTTHIPISQVASSITEERIVKVTNLLKDAIIAEGIQNPLIAISAINPHAGENGFMGHEDEEITKPAIKKLTAAGVKVEGPFPPDTLFIKETLERFDGIVTMYHDQGHIPFKMLAFDKGVNSTLGLPIIRTSVDHGTAFNIAWKQHADTGSLKAAIKLALQRAENRQNKV
jgi:4-hydroxythreonine-4-phosphate dehydrogenase